MKTFALATAAATAVAALLAAARAHPTSPSHEQTAAKTQQLIPQPVFTEKVRNARWAIARANFGVISTISSSKTDRAGVAWGNIVAVSDGVGSDTNASASTGMPYFYLTDLDETAQDAEEHPIVSFSVSQATFPDAGYCASKTAEDPVCAGLRLLWWSAYTLDNPPSQSHPIPIPSHPIPSHPISFPIPTHPIPSKPTQRIPSQTCVRCTLTGKLTAVTSDDEKQAGLAALYSKHPAMKNWPQDHGWKVLRLEPVGLQG